MPTYKVPAKINYALPGGPGVNVWHVRANDEEADLPDAIAAIQAFYTSLRGVYVNTTTVTIGEGVIRDPYGTPEYVDDAPVIVQGTAAGNAASPLLQYCVAWRTTSATRRGRGRTFIGPLSAVSNDVDGTPTSALLTIVRNAASQLVTASTGVGGWAMGIYSTRDALLRDVTGSSVQDRFAFLSSRRD